VEATTNDFQLPPKENLTGSACGVVARNAWGKEVAVDPSELESKDVDEEARSAIATGHARISFQCKGCGLAADDAHGGGRIDGFGRVSAAVDDPAIVAMAENWATGSLEISISTVPQRQSTLIA
jgi:hypothetical protein